MVKKTKNEQTTVNQDVCQDENTQATTENATQQQPEADNVAEPADEQTDKSAPVTAENDEWKDKYLRLSAEFDNYRKRTLKEKMDLIESGGEDVIKLMLGVMDDFGRALAAMQNATDVAAVREGVELIAQKMTDALKTKGVSEIEAIGQPLDTDLHEAVAKFPAGDDKKGLVIDVVQKGYKLKDKVIRYAKVVVGD